MSKVSLSSKPSDTDETNSDETRGRASGSGYVDSGSAAESDDDRRRGDRAAVTVRIDYATVDEMFSEFTRDINEGGVFIETEKPHQAGTEVSMQFHLPGSGEVLETIGYVVRVSSGNDAGPPGMGIEFNELTAEDRRKIDLIVRALRSATPQ